MAGAGDVAVAARAGGKVSKATRANGVGAGGADAGADGAARLVVIYSESSSQYAAVEREVLTVLRAELGEQVVEYSISGCEFRENVKRIGKILRDGDVVLVAGGDGTANVATNGVLESGCEVAFAALPYGNFNDMARTLKISRISDIFKEILRFVKNEKNVGGEGENLSKNGGKLMQNAAKWQKLRKWYPLEVWVDGKLWRYAPCYVTIGMVAEACELFDLKEVRDDLRRGKRKVKPYQYMAKWYFRNRKTKQFLPDFSVNGAVRRRGTSDYAAVNGKSMARVMKGGEDYLDPGVFRRMTEKLTSLPRLTWLMLRAILVRTPGVETGGDVLEFRGEGEVEVQAEGEYERFKNPRKIRIFKSKKYLRIIEGSL